MSQEIERKFLIPQLPQIPYATSSKINQGYLAIGEDSEARVRQNNDTYTLTVKTAGELIRGEFETALDEDQFSALWPSTEGKRIEKTRLSIPYLEHMIELDVYGSRLSGLLVAEIEFGSEIAAHRFIAPSWFGRDITTNRAYKNQQLALHGTPN